MRPNGIALQQNFLLHYARQLGTLSGLLALGLVLWALTPHFLTLSNLLNVAEPQPRGKARLLIHRKSGKTDEVPLTVRIDTPIEVEYYKHGGILPYVLRQILGMT